ncbi:chemotaxis protein CheW, partial [Arthrospira platensis SPKY1]|nr:chemotaxis protein CheW [Arthrospira platensis SPKY1]
PWDGPGRVCQLECCSASAERALIEVIERVAEPGSVSFEPSPAQDEWQDACVPMSGGGWDAEIRLPSPAACVAFFLGSRRFAADAPGVEEIRFGDPIHPAPGGSALVCGTIEIDGDFVPVIDLQQCLGLGSGRVRKSSMQLISRLAGETVAVLVDDVEDIITIGPEAIQPVAGVLARDLPRGVRGLFK